MENQTTLDIKNENLAVENKNVIVIEIDPETGRKVGCEYPKREGQLPIPVNQEIKVKLGEEGMNNFNKKQFSGFVNDRYFWLPVNQLLNAGLFAINHIQIVEKGETKRIKNPEIKIKRLNQGGMDKADGQKKIGYEFTFRVTEDCFE